MNKQSIKSLIKWMETNPMGLQWDACEWGSLTKSEAAPVGCLLMFEAYRLGYRLSSDCLQTWLTPNTLNPVEFPVVSRVVKKSLGLTDNYQWDVLMYFRWTDKDLEDITLKETVDYLKSLVYPKKPSLWFRIKSQLEKVTYG
jgi:hypothetical protein